MTLRCTEYRLRLRADNAATRLTPLAIAASAASSERVHHFEMRSAHKGNLRIALDEVVTAETLIQSGVDVKRDAGKMSLFDWLRFPTVSLDSLLGVSRGTSVALGETESWWDDVVAEVEQDGRYAPYLDRQAAEIRDLAANEQISLPVDFDYRGIAGLSNEMVERLDAARPDTLAAAGRVRGITPAALATILVHAKRAVQKRTA
jgi:tRNA uridine 5-carboxymethylaminomethyl modification enzyme